VLGAERRLLVGEPELLRLRSDRQDVGGRGSYVGALLGAVLLQEIVSATSFLGLDEAWQGWLPGVLILVGAAVFSRARGRRSSLVAAA